MTNSRSFIHWTVLTRLLLSMRFNISLALSNAGLGSNRIISTTESLRIDIAVMSVIHSDILYSPSGWAAVLLPGMRMCSLAAARASVSWLYLICVFVICLEYWLHFISVCGGSVEINKSIISNYVCDDVGMQCAVTQNLYRVEWRMRSQDINQLHLPID